MELAQALEQVEANPKLLEVARKAVEDVLIERRDSGIGMLRNNGLVCKHKDSTPSSVIRMGMEEAIAVGLDAIVEHLKKGE